MTRLDDVDIMVDIRIDGQPLPRLTCNCAPAGFTRRTQSSDNVLLQMPDGRPMYKVVAEFVPAPV